MQFGNRDRFAVSMELSEDSGGPWMFGKFCYWIDGKMIGRYDAGTSLRDLFASMKWIVHDSGKREDCTRFGMPSDDAFESVDSTMYGHPKKADWETSGDLTARFEVCPKVDILDDWKVYLIECSDQARMLYKNLSDLKVSESLLRRGEFDACIQRAWDELNAVYDRALGSEF
jgi:hypothetical protein